MARKSLNSHEINRDDRCNEVANRSRRVPLFCFCCDNKVREITVGPKCIFPRWRTIFTRALQFSPRRHPRGLNLRCPGKVLSVLLPACEHRARYLFKYLTGCKRAKKVHFNDPIYGFIETICISKRVTLVPIKMRNILSNKFACLTVRLTGHSWWLFFYIHDLLTANIIMEEISYSRNILHYIGLIFIQRGSNHSV